ncbi:MAG TPA: diguanylate cyclase [Actinomycetales bacterium]
MTHPGTGAAPERADATTSAPPAGSRVSLMRLLRRSSTSYVAVLGLLLVVMAATTTYTLGVTEPDVEHATELTRELRINHEGMLDQETALRAWITTGEDEFLQPYREGLALSESQRTVLALELVQNPEVAGRTVEVLLKQQSWQDQWVPRALEMGRTSPAVDTIDTEGRIARLLREGKVLFDAYRVAYLDAVTEAAGHRDAAIDHQRQALQVQAVSQTMLVVLAILLVIGSARRLGRLVAQPLQVLDHSVGRLRAGEVLQDLPPMSVRELGDVASALTGLSQDLDHERSQSLARHERGQRVTGQLEIVLTSTQAMATCDSDQALAQLLVASAAQLAHSPASLWLRNEDGHYHCAAWSEALRPSPVAPDAAVHAVGADGRRRLSGEGISVPLIGSGTVLAVLHVDPLPSASDRTAQDAMTGLEALALTAAAYLQSLRLLERTRLQASTDQLTGLANRGQMDARLDEEWSRSTRHGRPLSFALLDLDHFKAVNDTAGHLVGDQWLQLVATAAQAQVRVHDVVFRYGGEEIAVLLPETSATEAHLVLERIRAAVEQLRGPDGAPHITTSAGVAELAPDMLEPADLVAAADAALYAAKRSGRNAVVVAGRGGTLHDGPALTG